MNEVGDEYLLKQILKYMFSKKSLGLFTLGFSVELAKNYPCMKFTVPTHPPWLAIPLLLLSHHHQFCYFPRRS